MKFRFVNQKVIVIGLLCFILSGCSGLSCCLTLPMAGKSSIHYVVFGLGIISVPKPDTQTAILATKTQVLGLVVSDQPGAKIGVGYSSGSVVAIPDGAEDVRVEISQQPGGKVAITAPSANLK